MLKRLPFLLRRLIIPNKGGSLKIIVRFTFLERQPPFIEENYLTKTARLE